MLGAVLAYAIALGNPNGFVRKVSIAGSGVLAQFGGVTLAFAFSAAIGPTSGFLFHATWYYDFPWGIGAHLRLLPDPADGADLPAGDQRDRPQWREATENLGGSSWDYWRHVGVPLLLPSFLGCMLLLFANALSAYATIQAWENQIPYVVPQKISQSLSSEVGSGLEERGPGAGARDGPHGRGDHDRLHVAPAEDDPMATVTTPGDVLGQAPVAPAGGFRRSRRRRQTIFRTIVLLSFAAFFLLPLGAMVAYSFRGTVPGTTP